jgi:hypothetical protein
MSLGRNFVWAHLPSFLVLWRDALPQPTSKNTTSGTGCYGSRHPTDLRRFLACPRFSAIRICCEGYVHIYMACRRNQDVYGSIALVYDDLTLLQCLPVSIILILIRSVA